MCTALLSLGVRWYNFIHTPHSFMPTQWSMIVMFMSYLRFSIFLKSYVRCTQRVSTMSYHATHVYTAQHSTVQHNTTQWNTNLEQCSTMCFIWYRDQLVNHRIDQRPFLNFNFKSIICISPYRHPTYGCSKVKYYRCWRTIIMSMYINLLQFLIDAIYTL